MIDVSNFSVVDVLLDSTPSDLFWADGLSLAEFPESGDSTSLLNWLEKQRQEEDDASPLVKLGLGDAGEPVDVAAYDTGVINLIGVDTHAQAAVKPPESAGAEDGGFSINPLLWTVAGVVGIVALDSADSDDGGGNSGNRAPEFVDDTDAFTINEDEPLTVSALATDRDGDELTYTVPNNSRPDNGTVVEGENPGEYIYTPDAEFSGEDSFTVRVSDGNLGGTITRTFTITVENVNDAPELAAEQNVSGNVDQVLRVVVSATDVEGDTLSYTFAAAQQGTVSPGDSPGEYFYTPGAGFSGEDSFSVTVSDGENEVTQTVNIRVGLPNEAPVVEESQDVSVDEDDEVTVTVDADDIDGDTLTYTAGDPQNGTVETGDVPGQFVYTPNEDFNGEDSFVVTVDDGKGGTATQTVTVTVNPVADAYELSAEDVEVAEGDADGNTMVFELKLDRAPFDEDVVINVVSQNGTATAGDDFEAVDTQLTFAAGEDTVELTVNILGDTIAGIDETFSLLITGELLDDDVTATGTILNDDLDPNLDAPVMDLLAESDTGELDDDNITSEDDLKLQILAEPGVDIEIFQDGESLGMAAEDSDGVYSFDVDNLDDGSYQFVASLSINGGSNTLESQPLTVTVDSSAPAAPVVSLTPESDTDTIGDRITADDTPTVTIAAEAGAIVEVFVDGESQGEAMAGEAGQYSFTTSALSDGDHEFTAVATDPAGNSSSASAVLNIEVDTTAPDIPVIALDADSDSGVSDDDGITQSGNLVFTITAEAGVTVDVLRDGASVGIAIEDDDNGNPGQYTFVTTAPVDGDYQFTAVATDVAGNASAESLSIDVTIDTSAPLIAALSADADADTVTVTFDEAIGLFDDADFSFTVNELAAAVTGVSADTDSLTFSLDADLQTGDSIDVALLADAIADLAGNGIAAVGINDDPAGVVA